MKLVVIALSILSVFTSNLRKQDFNIHTMLPGGDNKIIGSPLDNMYGNQLANYDSRVQDAVYSQQKSDRQLNEYMAQSVNGNQNGPQKTMPTELFQRPTY